jgi:hypothetical protein
MADAARSSVISTRTIAAVLDTSSRPFGVEQFEEAGVDGGHGLSSVNRTRAADLLPSGRVKIIPECERIMGHLALS